MKERNSHVDILRAEENTVLESVRRTFIQSSMNGSQNDSSNLTITFSQSRFMSFFPFIDRLYNSETRRSLQWWWNRSECQRDRIKFTGYTQWKSIQSISLTSTDDLLPIMGTGVSLQILAVMFWTLMSTAHCLMGFFFLYPLSFWFWFWLFHHNTVSRCLSIVYIESSTVLLSTL